MNYRVRLEGSGKTVLVHHNRLKPRAASAVAVSESTDPGVAGGPGAAHTADVRADHAEQSDIAVTDRPEMVHEPDLSVLPADGSMPDMSPQGVASADGPMSDRSPQVSCLCQMVSRSVLPPLSRVKEWKPPCRTV